MDALRASLAGQPAEEAIGEAAGGRSPIRGVDHVLVGVADLEAARQAWLRLGFLPSPRGRHIGWGTANYCIMFPGDYIELLGIVDRKQFTNNLDRFLERREGLLGVAFASDDPAQSAATLRARGIATKAPKDLSRLIELPGGDARPAFKLLELPPETTPAVSAFIVHHLTPELVWREAWCRHPNGARGLLAVTAVVEDPSAVAIPYAELFGFDAVLVRDGSVEVDSGGARLVFAAPDALPLVQPGLAAYPVHPVPWLAGLRLAVESLAATAYYFEQMSVPCRAHNDALLVAPPLANGVILEFVEG
ncbi:MAG: VOC family protein [Kiloniellales bacterium]